MGRVNWAAIIAAAFAVACFASAVFGNYEYAMSMGLVAVTAAILAHLR